MSDPPDDSIPTPLDELVRRAQRGDNEAFKQLWSCFWPDLSRYLERLESNRESREDLAQEIAIKAWQKLSQLEDVARCRAWLFTIATNMATDAHRRRKSRPEGTSQEKSYDIESPTRFNKLVEEMELTKRALETLPLPKRACLILEALGFRPHEIAEIVGISEGSARTYISDARRDVRQAYRDLECGDQHVLRGYMKRPSRPYEESMKRLLGTKQGNYIVRLFKELLLGKGDEFALGKGDEFDER